MNLPSIGELGDRHLKEFTPEQRRDFLPGRILVRASKEVGHTRDCQISLWFLANLLARQYGVVHEIQLDIPDVPTLPGVALFGHKERLYETLRATILLIAGPTVRVVGAGSSTPCDVEVSVGPCEAESGSRFRLGIWGSGWRAYSGPKCPAFDHTNDNPLGALLAACFGAAACFRVVTNWHDVGRRAISPVFFSLWDGTNHSSWAALPAGEWPGNLSIPPFYLCGAGAVGQAFCASIGFCPSRRGHAVILDKDPLDDTNANRYVLSYPKQETKDKTAIAAEVLRSELFTVDPKPMHWEKYVEHGAHRTDHPQLVKDEKKHKYRLLISCVDTNHARHNLQAAWPRLIFGGSTSSLLAQVMSYDVGLGGECLMCNNKLPKETSIEAKVAELKALPPEKLAEAMHGLSEGEQNLVREFLENPGCGHAAETIIDELGRKQRREFAVGFVSAGAGILLAAALIQHAIGRPGIFGSNANHLGLSFTNNISIKNIFSRKPDCECEGKGSSLFHRLWKTA